MKQQSICTSLKTCDGVAVQQYNSLMVMLFWKEKRSKRDTKPSALLDMIG